MNSPLHLLCCAAGTALLLGCSSSEADPRSADLDSLPPPAPEVPPVPAVGSNPLVSVPRVGATGSAQPAPASPRPSTTPPPATPPRDTVYPAPPMDVRPSIPLGDTLR